MAVAARTARAASLWLDAVLPLAEVRAIARRGWVWYDGQGEAREPTPLLERQVQNDEEPDALGRAPIRHESRNDNLNG